VSANFLSFFHTILIQHRSDRGSIVNWSPSASSSASYGYNTSSDRSSIVNWSQTASSSVVLYRISFVFVLFLPLPNLIQRRSDRGSIIDWSPSASSSASYGYSPNSDRSSIINWSQTASSSLLLYRFGFVFVFVLFLSFPVFMYALQGCDPRTIEL
jgi:hypothetical protein